MEQIRENPYYQYFIGLPGYEDKIPFVPSLLVKFRKRISEDVLNEINEIVIEYNTQKNDDDNDSNDSDDSNGDDNRNSNDADNISGSLCCAWCFHIVRWNALEISGLLKRDYLIYVV